MADAAVQMMMEMKKVYADLMLHSAQEAAARIVMSEKRAFRFQKEAEFAKKEALGMVLRLKKTMDSKLHEAEVLSVRQQKKIKVLEGKLQEAKTIVTELRKELAIVCNELERIKKGQEAKSLNNILSNSLAHGSEQDEASRGTKPDDSANILESRSNSKFGPKSTLYGNSLALAIGDYESQSQSLKSRSTALMTSRDIPYLPSIFKRTKVPSVYGNRSSQGIHSIIVNKSGGSFSSANEMAGSRKNTTTDFMMPDSGGKNIQSELTTHKTGSNHTDPEKPVHEEHKRHVEYTNTNSPLYEHLPTRDLIHHEPTGHFPSKTAVNGSSPSEGNLTCSERKAQKDIETSRLTKTHNFKTLLEYGQEKENNDILIKSCSSKNTSGNDLKDANVPTKEGVEVVQYLSAKGGVSDHAIDIVPFNSNAGPDDVKDTKGSFQSTTDNILHYSRKRSRQPKDNTIFNREGEASSEPVYLKRKNEVPGLQSSENQHSQSIAQVAHQLLALSDSKWCR